MNQIQPIPPRTRCSLLRRSPSGLAALILLLLAVPAAVHAQDVGTWLQPTMTMTMTLSQLPPAMLSNAQLESHTGDGNGGNTEGGAPSSRTDSPDTRAGSGADGMATAGIERDAAAMPVIMLGPGDAVTVQVYGRPEMNSTSYISDNGTISVPLAGAVSIAGMSPAQAGEAVAAALRQGQYLVNPQVTITLSQFRSQQISVLGEVRTPGRYPVESRTSIVDLLAQAGGETENGADTVYVLRPHPGAGVDRYPVDLRSLRDDKAPVPTMALIGGDEVYVPPADRFYIYGEVQAPNAYRLEPGMTVIQAISRSGGVTPRGSTQRIVISRRTASGHISIDAKPFDPVRPDDVIQVKERIF